MQSSHMFSKFIQIKSSIYKKSETTKSCESLIHSYMAVKMVTLNLELVAKLL